MLKRHHRFFQSIQVFRDAVLVAVAFVLAYVTRFSVPSLLPFDAVSPREEVIWVGIMLVVVWPLVGWMGGLYVSRRSRSIAAEMFDVFRTSAIAFLVLVALTYFVRDERFSRGVLILWSGYAVALVSPARIVSRLSLRALRARGYNLRHVLLVGTGDLARRVMETINTHAELGLRIHGVVAVDEERHRIGCEVDGTPIIGTVAEIRRLVVEHRADQVLVALPIGRLGALKEMMQGLSQETVDVRVIPDFYQYMTLCGSVEEFAGLPIISLQSAPLMGWDLVTKRGFDLVVSVFGLLTALPLLLLVGGLIKLTSRGPVFYLQERVGMDGRRFEMIKFRTMGADAESDGAQMARPDDPRRTPLGGLLRRMSIDELPQLINVLKGDMSLVGPRPERPCFIEDFKREIPRYALRHKIKAGITGWAQVNGMRGNTSMRKRVELDLYYIENWSLLLDVKILLRTVFGGFLSPHAY
ncbi:MAG: undecaprenyl-phosphate glucose phosphotransferase [Myxococcota bacterium]